MKPVQTQVELRGTDNDSWWRYATSRIQRAWNLTGCALPRPRWEAKNKSKPFETALLSSRELSFSLETTGCPPPSLSADPPSRWLLGQPITGAPFLRPVHTFPEVCLILLKMAMYLLDLQLVFLLNSDFLPPLIFLTTTVIFFLITIYKL